MPQNLLQSTKTITDRFKAPIVSGPWTLCESTDDNAPSYDKEIYLARLRGPMALYDGTSLNNRWYSKGLWETAISENQDRIRNNDMFGTIGHDQPFDEAALDSGKISHKITGLWLNESDKTVHGEILILNSSSGRELNTYLRSGMKISTSSRAYGNFKGKTPDGADIIDENGFYLQGFDFVLNPGVEAACPRIVESITEERKTMDETKALMESMAQRSQLMVELNEAVKKADKAQRDLSEAQAQKQKLAESLQKSNRALRFIANKLGTKTPVDTAKKLNEGLGKWLLVPELQELAREVGMFDTSNTTFDQTVKKIVESHAKASSEIKAFKAIGETPALINETLQKQEKELSEFRALGTAQALDEELKAYHETGTTPQKVNLALDMLEAYKAAASGMNPEQLTESLEKAQKAISVYNKARKVVAAKKIRIGLKMHESKEPAIQALLEKMSAKEVIAHLKALRSTNEAKKPAQVTASTKVPTTKIVEQKQKTATGAVDTIDASRALKLVESANKNYKPVTTPDPFAASK